MVTSTVDRQGLTDVIEHVNDDHQDELLSIAQVFIDADAERATLLDVSDSGLKLQVDTPAGSRSHLHAFSMTGDAEDKILFLAYQAMVRQRKLPPGTKTRYFRFVERQTLSANMLRLVFTTDRPLPANEPGYAFFFSLKALRPTRQNKDVEYSDMPLMMRLWFRGMLTVMKWLKPTARRKLLNSMYSKSKYYTLRASFPAENDDSAHRLAWIDVYTHGDSPGSVWARSLAPGDMVKSTAEYREKTDHVHEGRVLLIADETAMPALAAVLENWRNPLPPTLVLISRSEAEQDYVDASLIPEDSQVYRIVADGEERKERVEALLRTLGPLDAAWGALEHSDAKMVRVFLRTRHSLAASNNRVRGYWKLGDD
ncbi:SIP domain-containing protein [Shinella sp. BYT-45]|uniref:siderophore-interacting protein n=1 Tax=Shinella sp. BYT-45 TaxID=3377377 RepID=UPI00398102E1